MVFKAGVMAAAGLSVLGLDSPAQAEGLMKQMQSLGLQVCALRSATRRYNSPRWPLHRHQSVVQVALRDPSEDPDPTTAATRDPKSAKKILRQRKNALSRERERQQAVEQALQRLKAEKEMRMKQREALRAKQQRRLRGGVRCVVFARGC